MEPTDFARHVEIAVKEAIKTYSLSWDRWSDDLTAEAWLAVVECLDALDAAAVTDLDAYVYS